MGNTITSRQRRDEDRMLCYTIEAVLRQNPAYAQRRAVRPKWMQQIESQFVYGQEDVPVDSLIRRETNDGFEYVMHSPSGRRITRSMDAGLIVFNQKDFPRLAQLSTQVRQKIFDVFIQEARNIVCRSYMTRIRWRLMSTLGAFSFNQAPNPPALISPEEFERKTTAVINLDIAPGQSDESVLRHYWGGRFVRRHLPWSGAQVPANYERSIGEASLSDLPLGRTVIPGDDLERVAMPFLEMDYFFHNWGKGFMVLADGEPEFNYFPHGHPMRAILSYLDHNNTPFNTRMITEERYWDSHPTEASSTKPRELATTMNDIFEAYEWNVDEPGQFFTEESVLSGVVHAWYIYWRNAAIYVRTQIHDIMDLFKDPGMLQKYAGMHDLEDHEAFLDKLRSIFGYHGHATSNPLYNFTPQDLQRLEGLQGSRARDLLEYYVAAMGYNNAERYLRIPNDLYREYATADRIRLRWLARKELGDAPYARQYLTLGDRTLEEYLRSLARD